MVNLQLVPDSPVRIYAEILYNELLNFDDDRHNIIVHDTFIECNRRTGNMRWNVPRIVCSYYVMGSVLVLNGSRETVKTRIDIGNPNSIDAVYDFLRIQAVRLHMPLSKPVESMR